VGRGRNLISPVVCRPKKKKKTKTVNKNQRIARQKKIEETDTSPSTTKSTLATSRAADQRKGGMRRVIRRKRKIIASNPTKEEIENNQALPTKSGGTHTITRQGASPSQTGMSSQSQGNR